MYHCKYILAGGTPTIVFSVVMKGLTRQIHQLEVGCREMGKWAGKGQRRRREREDVK